MPSIELKKMTKGLIVFVCILLSVTSLAQVKVENIEFSSLPGDKIEIRMQFDDIPPIPTGYTIEQPARIALDLKGVISGLSSKYHRSEERFSRNAETVQ